MRSMSLPWSIPIRTSVSGGTHTIFEDPGENGFLITSQASILKEKKKIKFLWSPLS